MYYFTKFLFIIVLSKLVATDQIYETDMNFRVEAGTKTCFFEKGKAGQMMELYYQVLDGQHGDLDISVDVIDPRGIKLISDYKHSQNSIIMDLEYEGDYVFCLDNTYSVMNSKLVFVYVVIEDKKSENETEVSVVDSEGQEHTEEEILEWVGEEHNGDKYTVKVTDIAASLMRTLNYVVRARHMLDMYSASKSRDSYIAIEDTFIVDMWSAFQITFMMCVGFVQVYMIKKLFDRPCNIQSHY
ncbi:transmembrane emp24 domain-containing protein 1-like [Vanessa atalanta]|uniref:transmembrane emp24 domain-containing protein 1-like n=1 Tax=Vanessa atalanta TaxID=42275 RepID=UPI001FCCD5D8|nr:transmembrane emp24 domain-containing protein 1-like [Vanessa atalanta]